CLIWRLRPEQFSVGRALLERGLYDPQLWQPVIHARHNLCRGQSLQFIQQRGQGAIVHRTSVIRIYQAEIPEFASLVYVSNAWGGQLDQRLREAVDAPRQ